MLMKPKQKNVSSLKNQYKFKHKHYSFVLLVDTILLETLSSYHEVHKEGNCSNYPSRIYQIRRKQTPNYAKAYGKHCLLSDMAMKICHLAAFSSLFYHISDLHTILTWHEYDPAMSQQCTPCKFEVEVASVDMLELHFHLGPSINSNAFANDTCCLLLAWHFERTYAVRYNPCSKTSIKWFSF